MSFKDGEIVWPEEGQVYRDDISRSFKITKVQKDDPRLRHIIGVITVESIEYGYSCSIEVFRLVWRRLEKKKISS